MNRSLHFGVHAGPSDVPYATRREYWCEAERLGYDWASVGDHFIANPVFGARDTDSWNEAWTWLAALAEATSRIHIGVMVTSVGYRHPPVLAKMAATVDVISEGRLEFGIGAGYLETEYRMYGLPFPPAAVRLEQLDEAIRVCKSLWTKERSDFVGKHYTLTGAVCEPKPMQKPTHPSGSVAWARRRRCGLSRSTPTGGTPFRCPSRKCARSWTCYATTVRQSDVISTRSASNWVFVRSCAKIRMKLRPNLRTSPSNHSYRWSGPARWRLPAHRRRLLSPCCPTSTSGLTGSC